MNDPLVSVIIPAYNSEKYIFESITSVLNQTYSNLEIIIVNDGSTDNTCSIIKSFSDTRIIYIEQANSGQCSASNNGIRNARGEYIKFFDADDVMNERHIELQIQKMANRTTVICGCEWGRFYNDDYREAIFESEKVWSDTKPLTWLKNILQKEGDMLGAWLWLIPRQLLEKSGNWDERLSLNNDFEFSVRLLLQADELLYTPGAKLYYRTGGATLSVSKSKKAFEAAYLSTQLGCSYLLSAENSSLMRLICANRYQKWLYRIYPSYPELCDSIEKEIVKLGGSNLEIGGGVVLKRITTLFGWKVAKKIQNIVYKTGYLQLIGK